MSRSPFQRFIDELRRRHVPQTAAIYLVAAWAAIEFADVVVPNLNGPQWIVTAVIVAALVGFPVMLVVAWVFEWGPDGIHRTPDAAAQRMEAPPSYDPETGGVEPSPAARTTGQDRSQPWLAALAVLVVGIGSAVAVAYVLRGNGADGGPDRPAVEAAAPEAGPEDESRSARRPGGDSAMRPPLPPTPGDILGPGFSDSIQREIRRAFGALDSLDMAQLQALGQRAAAEAAVGSAVGLIIATPTEWRSVAGPAPVTLAEGDTLRVRGAAYDTAGVARVAVEGRVVAEPDSPEETVAFQAVLVGRAAAGTRTVVIAVSTVDGREVRREYSIIQLPGGTP